MSLTTTNNRQDFTKQVIDNKKVVLVDFWAQWCPPCRAMAPILYQIAKDMEKQVDVVKVDIEESPDNGQLANEYGVQGIPNMLIFKDGTVVDQIVGMVPAMHLQDLLQKHAQ